jgi:hypothetical protein
MQVIYKLCILVDEPIQACTRPSSDCSEISYDEPQPAQLRGFSAKAASARIPGRRSALSVQRPAFDARCSAGWRCQCPCPLSPAAWGAVISLSRALTRLMHYACCLYMCRRRLGHSRWYFVVLVLAPITHVTLRSTRGASQPYSSERPGIGKSVPNRTDRTVRSVRLGQRM